MRFTNIFAGLCFLSAGLLSCSSDNAAEKDNPLSVIHVDTTLSQQQVSLKPFEPDANWVTPPEVISEYGPSGIIRDVVIDRNGIIWMAAWDGIVSYDMETKQFTYHMLKFGLSHHRVYSVMQDSNGNMWFGTLGAGTYKYDGVHFTNLSSNNGMIDNTVLDLFEDSKGNIWFATNKGVSRYDGKQFVNLDSTNGLPQEIYSISQDNQGVIWIGGEAGLFKVTDSVIAGKDLAREVVTSYDTHYANVRDLYWNGTSMCIGCSSGFYCTAVGDPNTILRINDKFTSYINGSHNSDLIITSDGIFYYSPPNYKPHESPALPFATVVDDKSNLGIFGAREAQDGTLWYGAMDGLHSVKDGKDESYKKP